MITLISILISLSRSISWRYIFLPIGSPQHLFTSQHESLRLGEKTAFGNWLLFILNPHGTFAPIDCDVQHAWESSTVILFGPKGMMIHRPARRSRRFSNLSSWTSFWGDRQFQSPKFPITSVNSRRSAIRGIPRPQTATSNTWPTAHRSPSRIPFGLMLLKRCQT